jgi:hypothetical protein
MAKMDPEKKAVMLAKLAAGRDAANTLKRELKSHGVTDAEMRGMRGPEKAALLQQIKDGITTAADRRAARLAELGPDPTLPPPPATLKPGSKAHNDSLPKSMQLPAAFTDEAIAASNAFKLTPSVVMTQDEMDKKLRSTINPFDEAAAPYVAANPNEHFAFQSPMIQEKLGTRGMTPVVGRDGKPVTVAKQTLYYESKQAREYKNNLSLLQAKQQAANATESYNEIRDRLRRMRSTVGESMDIALKDGEFFDGNGGFTLAPDGTQVPHGGGGVKIGIYSGKDVSIVR